MIDWLYADLEELIDIDYNASEGGRAGGMNAEQAIEHFSYGISHDIYSEPVTTYAKLAVEALKEKAEREKGCEYCNDMKYMPFGEHEVYIDRNGKLDVDDDEDFQLNFCPMCGKRLEERHEAD